MLPIKVNNQTINVPTKWEELSIEQGLQIKEGLTYLELSKILVGFECDITNLIPFLEFNEPPKLLNIVEFTSFEIKEFDLYSGRQKMKLQRLLSHAEKNKLTDNDIMQDVLSIYFKVTNYVEGLTLFRWIIEEFMKLLELDKLLSSPPDSDYMLIGAYDMLKPINDYELQKGLAQAFNCDIDKTLDYPYRLIYMELMSQKVHSEINKRLTELSKDKNKQ